MAIQRQKSPAVEQRSKRIDFPPAPPKLSGSSPDDLRRWAVGMEQWYYELRTVLQRGLDEIESVVQSVKVDPGIVYDFRETDTVRFDVAGSVVRAHAKITEGPPGPPGRDGRNGRDGQDGANGINGVDGTNGNNGNNGREPIGASGVATCDPNNPGQLIITINSFTYPPA